MHDADEVVDGAVVGSGIVAVVEAMQLRDDHPSRQSDREEPELRLERKRPSLKHTLVSPPPQIPRPGVGWCEFLP